MTAGGLQAERAHDALPLLAMRRRTVAIFHPGHQMRDLVRDGVLQEVVEVFREQNGVELHMVLPEVRHAGRRTAQVEAARRHLDRNALFPVRPFDEVCNALSRLQAKLRRNRRSLVGLGDGDFGGEHAPYSELCLVFSLPIRRRVEAAGLPKLQSGT